MILANLTRAIRQQNWFAVAVEFLIVIAGVVIGFQIQGWNEGRRTQSEEKRLVEQLSEDVERAIENEQFIITTRQAENDSLIEAMMIVQGTIIDNEFTEDHCLRLWASEITSEGVAGPTVLDVIIDSDRLGLIDDTILRDQILNAGFHLSLLNSRRQDIVSGFFAVMDTYPELMPRTADPEMATGSKVECQLQAMRDNQGFQNRVLTNLGRSRALVIVSERKLEALTELQAILDDYTH